MMYLSKKYHLRSKSQLQMRSFLRNTCRGEGWEERETINGKFLGVFKSCQLKGREDSPKVPGFGRTRLSELSPAGPSRAQP